jgi:hypothetical protein
MAVLAAFDSLMTIEQTDQSDILFRIAMPNPKSAAIGSSTIQKRTTSMTRKLLIRIAFISVAAYLG